ncbi:anthranilate synthase component II [Streptomyces antarcticus]|uniref:anthranilate synthase component II n=1 Tax=Streptomyces antarcticus TaxID=2996458 RepID=UPI0022707AB8|nr:MULTISPECIES: aminodeoxychorismate/anthranilate synthase component II [unclassified Streptomyces]MCY0942923.1 aminodeoxychorismate/anthranilate synthase component II [Streptomyces sp. H34-AA3]MCY0953030.1 aminodeoxychorismate/anthranilate synthase component II [Streptomyces sp. H27-S2]MCZ4083117.1 aminodeoxychorismate/anthranilate synthase component II [Streptomyces sp. H34-S5]
MSVTLANDAARRVPKPQILVVDAFDSFVDILRQYLMSAGADPVMVRSNALREEDVREMAPEAILLGPGPGHPDVSGHVELVQAFAGQVPILGVCLGHQAIGRAYGAAVVPAQHLMHGKTSRIRHDGHGLFDAMPQDFQATRYHSLVVVEETLPPVLEVTARSCDDSYVMAMRHRTLPVESVQFHPESIRTEGGMRMIRNFVASATAFPSWWATRSEAA